MKEEKLKREKENIEYNQKKMDRIHSMEKKIEYLIMKEEEEAAAKSKLVWLLVTNLNN